MTKSEAILEARRMYAAGEFNRGIVEREPDSLNWDVAVLTCGHRMVLLRYEQELTEGCWQCAEAWASEQLSGRNEG